MKCQYFSSLLRISQVKFFPSFCKLIPSHILDFFFLRIRKRDLIGACICSQSFPSCQTLCDPMDCNPPGFSGHGILQARIPEWIAMPFSRGSSRPRDRTHVSYSGRLILYPLSHLGSPSHWHLICIYSALTGGSTILEALKSITVTPLLFPIVSAITKGHSKFKSQLCLSMSFWLGQEVQLPP